MMFAELAKIYSFYVLTQIRVYNNLINESFLKKTLSCLYYQCVFMP